MRGLGSAGLRIPFEPEAPVEGANLSPGDLPPAAARRPSPGFHPFPSSPGCVAGVNFFTGGASTWADELTWTSYKTQRGAVKAVILAAGLGKRLEPVTGGLP